MLRNRKAQAILELAILSSLIIMAFSILIGYSERYNREQSYLQQTFRAALKKAQAINNSVTWSTVDFRRLPNVTNSLEIGELRVFSSSNDVLWSDGKNETKPEAYFELNRWKITPLPIPDPPPDTGVTTTTFSYASHLNTTTDFNKREHSNAPPRKNLNAQDSITGGSDMNGVSVSLGSDLGQGGTYTGGGLTREESLQ